jgi:diguanylate cyclase (GGDEF)-like protein
VNGGSNKSCVYHIMQAEFIHDRLTTTRLERLSQFIVIVGSAWLTFALYYLFSGCASAGSACAALALISVALLSLVHGNTKRRRLVAHLFFFVTTLGVVIVSLVTGQADSYTHVFLCSGPILVTHLIGLRAASAWTLIIIGCIIAIQNSLSLGEFHWGPRHTGFDKTLHYTGLTMTIWLMSWQVERFFFRQTSHLINVTDSLRERTRWLTLAEETARVGHFHWQAATEQVHFSSQLRGICGLRLGQETPTLEHLARCFDEPGRREFTAAIELAINEQRCFSLPLAFELHGEQRFVTCRAFPECDKSGRVSGLFGVLRDDTESHVAAAELSEKAAALHKLARFDPLTDLNNRRQFHQHLEECTSRAKSEGSTFALLLLDLVGFKEINDSLGHPAGDALLRTIAKRLVDEVPNRDDVARLGGDEFTVVLHNVTREETLLIAKGLREAVSRPVEVNGRNVSVGVSIGAAYYPDDTQSVEELLTFADTAMYSAKTGARAFAHYDASMTDEIIRRREFDQQLKQAILQDEFFLAYQPQVDTRTGKILGFEALLRWNRAGREVSPNRFIGQLEASEGIVEVGLRTIHQAAKQAKVWIDDGFDITMSVNMSAVQFRSPEVVEDIKRALRSTGLPPHRLDIEITESVLIENVDNTASRLQELKDLGVTISIDDFGTGYSSLSYLKNFPLDRLKIDRAFIKDIPATDDGTIASSVIVLARSLEMEVLAEGVENEAQRLFLLNQGCDQYQGFSFSRPCSPEECHRLLRRELQSLPVVPE